jgi:hypothetical protein
MSMKNSPRPVDALPPARSVGLALLLPAAPAFRPPARPRAPSRPRQATATSPRPSSPSATPRSTSPPATRCTTTTAPWMPMWKWPNARPSRPCSGAASWSGPAQPSRRPLRAPRRCHGPLLPLEAGRMTRIFRDAGRPGVILPGNHDGLMFGIYLQPPRCRLDPDALRWNKACRRGAAADDARHKTSRRSLHQARLHRPLCRGTRASHSGCIPGLQVPPARGGHPLASWRNPTAGRVPGGHRGAAARRLSPTPTPTWPSCMRLPRAPEADAGVILIGARHQPGRPPGQRLGHPDGPQPRQRGPHAQRPDRRHAATGCRSRAAARRHRGLRRSSQLAVALGSAVAHACCAT